MGTVERDGLTVLEGCDWQGCSHRDVLCQEGRAVYCACHLGEDGLPDLEYGPMGACAQCGATSIWWTGQGVCLHVWCRKPWAASGEPERWEGGFLPLRPSAPKRR